MKKKGWLAILLAGALTLGMGVGCDKGNQGGAGQGGTGGGGQEETHTHAFAKEWSSDSEYHWHEATCGHADAVTKEQHAFQNGECTTCHYRKTDEDKIDKDTDPNAIVSDKLTEAEWEEALSEKLFENFMLYTVNDGQVSDWMFDGMNFRYAYSEQDFGGVAIGIYGEEKLEYYETDEHGKWQHMTAFKGDESYESMLSVFGYAEELRSMVGFLKDNFAKVAFDDARGAYLFTETDETHGSYAMAKFALKFKNGRLSAFAVDNSVQPDAVFEFCLIYGYGEAKIAPPVMDEEIDKDTDPNAIISDRLTEAEWKEALSKKTLDNFMLREGSGRDEAITSFVGKSWQYLSEDGGMVYDRRGGTTEFYQILEDRRWWHVTIPEGQEGPIWNYPGAVAEQLLSMKDKFAQATYDEELGAYLFTETDETHGSYAMAKFALKFKNGRLCAFAVDHSAQPDAVFEFCLIYGYGEAKIEPPTEYQEFTDGAE